MHGLAQAVTDEERALLLRIARCPLILAARQGWQPCTEIVACQQVAEPARQVPEAWAGNLRQARVLFLSSNPSISEPGPGQPADAVEPFPTASSADDEIVQFIGRRFDQTVLPSPWVRDDRSLLRNGRYWPKPTRFWVSIRARARELLGDGADPAHNYVMTEVVHCKSRGEAGVAAAAGTCARLYLDDIVRLSTAPVIAVVGKKAHTALTAFLPELPGPPYVFNAELGGRDRTVVYISHPSSWGEPKTIERQYGLETLVRLRAIARGSAAGMSAPTVPRPAVARPSAVSPPVTHPPELARPGRTGRGPAAQGPRTASAAAAGGRRPIQPVRGPFLAISDIQGECFVASRDTVSGQPFPATTLFIGETAGKGVGDTFDSYHKVNDKPCGVWTVIATAQGGRLTGGHLPTGTRKFRVNRLG
jgi:hypothetical protein